MYEHMGRDPVEVLVRPSLVLPVPAYGDPAQLSVMAGQRALRRRDGDPFTGPTKVPEVINRVCESSEGPGTLARLHDRAIERGWRVVVMHGRGWSPARQSVLVDSYSLRLRGVTEDGRDLRMFGYWVNGKAHDAGWLLVGGPLGSVRITITTLGGLIDNVGIRR